MTVSAFADLVKMATATVGTGTITLGAAVSGFRGSSALTNGATYSYAIQDGANYEAGQGVYTAAGTTLTRIVTISSNSNTAINLSGSAVVLITALSADFKDFGRVRLLGRLIGADFNSTADQPIAIAQPGTGPYIIARIVIANTSAAITATAKGAFYSSASKTGPLFGGGATTAYAALNAAGLAGIVGSAVGSPSLGTSNTLAPYLTSSTTIYLSLTAGNGSAVTADIYVFGYDLS